MIRSIKTLFYTGAVALAALGAATTASAEEATLNAVSCFPIGSPPGKPFEIVVEEINKRGAGVVKINMVGGAPAVGSPFTLTQKMSRGVYDMIGCTEAYFGNVLDEAPVLRLQERTFAELRQNGGIDMISKLMAEKGMHYIGRHHTFGPFFLWLSQKIDKPDLTGLHLRVSPVYTAFFTSLGATVQTSTISEVYTYMENGTVQGYGWPGLGWVPSWLEVTKFRVEPGFYDSNIHTLANHDKWQSLTDEQRKVITDTVLEFEANAEAGGEKFQAAWSAQKEKTAAGGLTAITFTGADAEKWSAQAKKAGWDEVLERSPENGKKLMELFTK